MKKAARVLLLLLFVAPMRAEEPARFLIERIDVRNLAHASPDVIKSAVSQGVAFVAGIILTIFFVLYGTRIIEGGLGLIEDDAVRRRTEYVMRDGDVVEFRFNV